MQLTQLTIGTSVVYASERSKHPHEDVQIGKVITNVFEGMVMVEWPGLKHLPQTHPIYRPQWKAVVVECLSPL